MRVPGLIVGPHRGSTVRSDRNKTSHYNYSTGGAASAHTYKKYFTGAYTQCEICLLSGLVNTKGQCAATFSRCTLTFAPRVQFVLYMEAYTRVGHSSCG